MSPQTDDGAITVLIVDDDPGVVTALVEVMDAASDLRVAGTARTVAEGVSLVATHRPDVALVDWRMPGGGGVECAAQIRSISPGTEVVAFSAHSDAEAVIEMLRAGAGSYVVKGAPAHELLSAIRRAAAGEVSVSEEVAGKVVRELTVHLGREAEQNERRRRVEQRIQRAVDGEGIRIVFQPIVNLTTREPTGSEALSRFDLEPSRPANVWFAEAASVDMGPDLELRAVKTALADCPAVLDRGYVALNVSPDVATSPRLASLLETTVPLDRVVLEITEHTPISDYPAFLEGVEGLRERGVRLSVDDVGAGFASLAHVLNVHPAFMKLDISLCRDIAADERRRAVTQGLVSLADQISVATIAEGIETEDAAGALRDLGVRFGQGYHLGRPAAAA